MNGRDEGTPRGVSGRDEKTHGGKRGSLPGDEGTPAREKSRGLPSDKGGRDKLAPKGISRLNISESSGN